MPPPPIGRRSLPAAGTGTFSFDGLPPADGGPGLIGRDGRERGFHARITASAGGNAYGYVRVDDGAPAGFPQFVASGSQNRPAYSSTGGATDAPAYETRLRTDVPTDGSAVVWLEPLLATPGYGFEYNAPSGGGPFAKDVLYLSSDNTPSVEGAWQDWGGASLGLSAGDYLLFGKLYFVAFLSGTPSLAPYLMARPFNFTDSLPVGTSGGGFGDGEMHAQFTAVGMYLEEVRSFCLNYSVDHAVSLRYQMLRSGAGSGAAWVTSGIGAGALSGLSWSGYLAYRKLG